MASSTPNRLDGDRACRTPSLSKKGGRNACGGLATAINLVRAELRESARENLWAAAVSRRRGARPGSQAKTSGLWGVAFQVETEFHLQITKKIA